jgi:hypothetical protein
MSILTDIVDSSAGNLIVSRHSGHDRCIAAKLWLENILKRWHGATPLKALMIGRSSITKETRFEEQMDPLLILCEQARFDLARPRGWHVET